MIMNDFREVKAGKKSLKRSYISIMMWFMGRAIQSAAVVDEAVGKEFAELPECFTFDLCIMPDGPHMIVGKSTEALYDTWVGLPKRKK